MIVQCYFVILSKVTVHYGCIYTPTAGQLLLLAGLEQKP